MLLSTLPDLNRPGYTIRRLFSTDADQLQALFGQCADFFVMTDGVPAKPTAAATEFVEAPEGKTPQDIDAFGLFDDRDRLLGTLIAVRHYPDAQTWWIGLMLLAPAQREQGLGAGFYRAFEQWVRRQGATDIALCAIAANTPGQQFWQRQGFALFRPAGPRSYGTKTHEVYVFRRSLPVAQLK